MNRMHFFNLVDKIKNAKNCEKRCSGSSLNGIFFNIFFNFYLLSSCKSVNPLHYYSELDSSESVKKLTKRVSLKRKYEELKLHLLFNKYFFLSMIKSRNSFDLKIPVFRVSNCMMYIWQLRVTFDSCGSRDKTKQN